MLLLGIDLETGASFDAPIEENFITEVGAVIWDTETQTPVKIYSNFVKNEKRISPEALTYTGIKQENCDVWGLEWDTVKTHLNNLHMRADYVVTHNGTNFDLKVLKAAGFLVESNHIDTMIDIDFPANCKSKNLTYLQGFHGFCYPGHRAVFDVMAMFRVLSNYDLNSVLKNANSPLVTVKALVDYHTKDKAKKFGFQGSKEGNTWNWVKQMKQTKYDLEKNSYDFMYKLME